MVELKLISIYPETKQLLDKLKQHPRESYNSVVKRLIDFYQSGDSKNDKK